jgi:hypothetical protein
MSSHSRIIKLSQGKFALVDEADYKRLNQWKWFYNHGYAVRNIKTRKKIRLLPMHRLVIDVPKGMFTDHINGDKLDNRRLNLRLCNKSQNAANTRKSDRPLTSRYKGVHWSRLHEKWRAKIGLNQRHLNIGLFDEEHHAAMAYDIWAKELFGDYAQTNFHTI